MQSCGGVVVSRVVVTEHHTMSVRCVGYFVLAPQPVLSPIAADSIQQQQQDRVLVPGGGGGGEPCSYLPTGVKSTSKRTTTDWRITKCLITTRNCLELKCLHWSERGSRHPTRRGNGFLSREERFYTTKPHLVRAFPRFHPV